MSEYIKMQNQLVEITICVKGLLSENLALKARIAELEAQVASQQSVQSDKCPACDGKGWFGAQFCEGEECPACEGTGICR